MTFSEYKKSLEKKFISLQLSDVSDKALRKWAISKGFDLTRSYSGEQIAPEDWLFHVTVFYTNNEVLLKNSTQNITPITLEVRAFGELGGHPVLLLNPKMNNLLDWREAFALQGLKDDYPSWLPHMSLSYNWHGTPDIVSMKYDGPPLIVDRLIVDKQ